MVDLEMYLCLCGYYLVFICRADAAPAWAGAGGPTAEAGGCGSVSAHRAEVLRRRLVYLTLGSHQKPRVSLNLFGYTTLTLCLYYTRLVLLYRWRLIVCSYFNLLNGIVVSLGGVATNFCMGVNESEIWHAVSNCWTAFQHGVISSTCNSCKVSGVYRALAMIHICACTYSQLLIHSSVESFLQSKKST